MSERMSGPDLPYTFAIEDVESRDDAEFRRRLRAAFTERFAAMEHDDLERLAVEVAEALVSLQSTFSGDPRDWGEYRRDAWAYGIVCGWDDAAMSIAERHGWRPDLRKRMERHAEAVEAMTDHPYLWPENLQDAVAGANGYEYLANEIRQIDRGPA